MKKVGRYEILEELGRGATGVVYKASDPTSGRTVALKILSLGISSAEGLPGAHEIFMREARAAGRLSHPRIVTIHDALEDPDTHSSCIVMEYVPGQTLEKALASGPRIETDRALEIAQEVGEALVYAHAQEVIHRDLKPANIILSDDGHAKLTDFGIAKMMAREGAMRTVSIMGTPSYMSPEQVSGGEVDHRSDLFSLGIVLYLMLTDEKPFKGDTAAVLFKIAYEDPVLPSQLNSQLTPGHDYLVLRSLAKNPIQRYSSAREFLDDLEDVQHGQPPRSEAKFPLSELHVGEPTLAMPRSSAQVPPAHPHAQANGKRVWITAVVGALILLLGGLAGLGVYRARNKPNSAPAAARGALPAPAPRPAFSPEPLPASGNQPPIQIPKSLPRMRPQGKSEAMAAARPRINLPAPAAAVVTTPPAEKREAAMTASTPSASSAKPSPPPASSAGRVVQLICKHDLGEGVLTVSNGSQVISQWALKGKKKGKFLGIGSSHAGTLSRSITIPADARELSVRVVSRDGSFDLSRAIPASPPAGSSSTLQVEINGDRLTVNWQSAPPPKS